MTRKFTAEQMIEAIAGSGGIMSTIAKRIGADWYTAQKYITEHPTVKAAYDAERQSILDLCESVVFRNVQIAQESQRNGDSGDTSDAKWVLSRLGKERGYTTGHEVSGPEGGPIEAKVNHAIDGDTAGTIFDILARVGALPSAGDDAEDDEIHSA
jgi:hypothetical protein